MVGQAADQRVDRAEFQQAARFKSKDGCQPVAGHANLSIGIEQQHAGFDGVQKAGHLGLQAFFRFAQRLLRFLILNVNEPPRPIPSHSSDLAPQVHANDAATFERRLERSRGRLLSSARARRQDESKPASPLGDRIARHGRK